MTALFRRAAALTDVTLSHRARLFLPCSAAPASPPPPLPSPSSRLRLGIFLSNRRHVCNSARGRIATAPLLSTPCLSALPFPTRDCLSCGCLSSRHALFSSCRTRPYSDYGKASRTVPDSSNKQPPQQQPGPSSNAKPITQTLSAARERTKSVSSKLRSSLTSLATPRENIYNLPNFLTVSRLFAAPATAYLLLHDQHTAALALFAYAGFTDLVDGWLARKWNLQTVAGSVIDPMADKALMIIVTVTLAVKGFIPAYLATLILGRDASLAIAAIYYRFASLPAPKTFMRYWDFSLPSAEVHPTTVSKYNTFLQLVLIGSTLALPVLTADSHHLGVMHDLGLGNVDLHGAMTYFQYLVAATTVWSGLSYAYLKNAVTILGDNEALKAKQGARGRAIIGVTFGSVVLAALYAALTIENEEKRKEEVEESSGGDKQ